MAGVSAFFRLRQSWSLSGPGNLPTPRVDKLPLFAKGSKVFSPWAGERAVFQSTADFIASITLLDLICLESSAKRSELVSSNGLPSSSMISVIFFTWIMKVFCTLGICSWWWSVSFNEWFTSYSIRSLAVSGPLAIHRVIWVRAALLPVRNSACFKGLLFSKEIRSLTWTVSQRA